MLAIAGMACIGAMGCNLLDRVTGTTSKATVLWHIGGGAAPGPPAFDGTSAYFLTNDHHVIALAPASGTERWRSLTDPRPDATYGLGGCLVSGSVVVCGDEDIVAFRRSDGAFAWRYHATLGYSPGAYQFKEHNGSIYAGSPSGTMYAIDAESGSLRWATQVITDTSYLTSITQLSVDDDIVVGAITRFTKPSLGGVAALDARTGQIRWNVSFPRIAPDSLTDGKSTALWQQIVFGSSMDGRIWALDRSTGAPLWWFRGVGTSEEKPVHAWGADVRSIVVHGNTLYAASNSGWFIAYDLAQQKEAWRVGAGNGSANASPIVYDDQSVYVIHANGHLNAFSATEPLVRWDVGTFAEGLFATVAVGSDRVFASGVTGYWAFRK
ncbi:MAG: PQQ-binding-like beta-propeller repeat protein [bacterium]